MASALLLGVVLFFAGTIGWFLVIFHMKSVESFGRETPDERTRRRETLRLRKTQSFSRERLEQTRRDLRQLAEDLRAERELSHSESEVTRDGLLKLLADAGSLNLTGKKGESLIRHGGALPSSTLSTYDQGRVLTCELKGSQTHYDLALRVELRRPSQVHLRIRHEDSLTPDQRERSTEHEVGHADFDAAFFLESRGWTGVEPLANYPEARAAVEKVFAIPGVSRMTVMRGRLRIDGEIDAQVPRPRLVELMGAVRLLARIYEGDAPMGLKLEHRAVELDVATRCPFCRDTLEAPDDVVIDCSNCHTRQHLECNQENGGCPVLGCGQEATAPQPTLHEVA